MAKRRVQLEITDKGLRDLLELKDQLYAVTMADAIRSSLRIVKKLEDEKNKGSRVVIIDKDNVQREVEFL